MGKRAAALDGLLGCAVVNRLPGALNEVAGFLPAPSKAPSVAVMPARPTRTPQTAEHPSTTPCGTEHPSPILTHRWAPDTPIGRHPPKTRNIRGTPVHLATVRMHPVSLPTLNTCPLDACHLYCSDVQGGGAFRAENGGAYPGEGVSGWGWHPSPQKIPNTH